MTANEIKELLAQRHKAPEWVFITEMRTETGLGLGGSERYMDAFAMHCWKAGNYRRIGYEIKTDRGDWLNELKQPWKKAKGFFLTNEFWFAVCPGVIDFTKDELRNVHGCGILMLTPDGQSHVEQHPHKRTGWPMPDTFVAALCRRLAPDPSEYIAEDSPQPRLELE